LHAFIFHQLRTSAIIGLANNNNGVDVSVSFCETGNRNGYE
jgi:hypothetical protein